MDRVAEHLAHQSGLLSRGQAVEAGLSDNDLRRMLRRRELVRVHPGVYVDHTGDLSWVQRAWAAVLFAWPAALSHESALRAAEGPGGGDPAEVHVAIGRHRRLAAPPGVRLHRMTDYQVRTQWNRSPPRIRYPEAALDVAGAAGSDFVALDVVARACQSRRTTATHMLTSLDERTRTPRRRWLASVLHDVAEGACSVLEYGYLQRVERAHRLPTAGRQRRHEATLGRTYRDVEYDGLVIELDGRLFHDTARQRDRDLDRDLDAAVVDQTAIRLGYGQVFHRPCSTALRLATLLRRRGWPGSPVPCGPDCCVRGVGMSPDDSHPPRNASSTLGT